MIRLQKILVPVDFSKDSEKAALYGLEIARDRKAKLCFLHIINERIIELIQDSALKGYKGDFLTAYKNMVRVREEELVNFIPEDLRNGVDIEFEIRRGKPVEEIVKLAKENGTDLIVVGTSGRSALKMALVGSVAGNVVNHAKCPVLVVRAIEHDFID